MVCVNTADEQKNGLQERFGGRIRYEVFSDYLPHVFKSILTLSHTIVKQSYLSLFQYNGSTDIYDGIAGFFDPLPDWMERTITHVHDQLDKSV